MKTQVISVVAAAIRHEGKIYSICKPARHTDVIHAMIRKGLDEPAKENWGFKLSDGRFANRQQAKRYAYLASQISRERFLQDKVLMSDDLW